MLPAGLSGALWAWLEDKVVRGNALRFILCGSTLISVLKLEPILILQLLLLLEPLPCISNEGASIIRVSLARGCSWCLLLRWEHHIIEKVLLGSESRASRGWILFWWLPRHAFLDIFQLKHLLKLGCSCVPVVLSKAWELQAFIALNPSLRSIIRCGLLRLSSRSLVTSCSPLDSLWIPAVSSGNYDSIGSWSALRGV